MMPLHKMTTGAIMTTGAFKYTPMSIVKKTTPTDVESLHVDNEVQKKDYTNSNTSTTRVVLVVFGLYACFLASTVFQEKLYAYRPVGENGERFESAPLLTLVKSITSIFVARSAILYFNKGEERVKPSTSSTLVMALIRCVSTICALYSLNFISYPFLVLGRSVKIVPVLVSEILFDRKIPSIRRCASVTITSLGLLFFSTPSFFERAKDSIEMSMMGFFLLFLSLCADGALSFTQKKMVKTTGKKPHVLETMLCMAYWQAFFSFIVVIATFKEKGGIDFCMKYPESFGLILWPSVIEAIGQIFIYELVIHHGPFFTSLVTLVRKIVTIVISVLLFGHVITPIQWVSIIMVFSGCFLDTKKPPVPVNLSLS